MEDGIYLQGPAGWVWVAESSLALTIQANDLTKPDSIQLTYSNQFTLPHSLAIQRLLENAEQLDAGSQHPYKLIPARLIEEDEIAFEGVAELQQFQGEWQVSLYDPQRALFDKLAEKSIRDLDLSWLDHSWTLDQINARAGATEGVCYPILDYGTIDGGIVAQDTIFPAVFVPTILTQMLQEEGYRPVGAWLDDPLLKQMVIPFTEAEPLARDQEWIDARTARVTVETMAPTPMFGGVLNQIMLLSVDDRELDNWKDGKANNFNTTTYSYVADAAMRLKVVAVQRFMVKVDVGTVEVKLQLEKNGAFVEQAYWSKTTGYNQSRAKIDQLELDIEILLKKGDTLKIRRIVQKRSAIAQWEGFIMNDPDSTYASFIPDATIHTGDTWLVAQNLPDLKCTELLLSLAFKMGGWFAIDNRRKTVELFKLTDVTRNRVQAVDWSAYLEEGEEPSLSFQIDPYAQRNLLKYKEQSGVDKGFGDGVIRCDRATLPAETTLFTLPFSASMESARQIGSYGAPLLIETRTITGSGETLQIQKKATGARVILVEPTKSFEISTKILNTAGEVVPATVTLTGCWFGRRPKTVLTNDNAFSLSFDPGPAQISEVALIARYYDGLKQVLRRPRVFTPSIHLRSHVVANLNPKLPIRLRNVRVGEIEISDGYFYLNKVNNYRSGMTCTATLIAF
ncbi:hypothetical protein [Larkinella terrae]|uniref:Uncharacterized protein n=1 Tax=Larkinella terrae TaxID=2025311 RepID=A0A7K0EH89_9BACT|nr:hypothetical protein [Larkinella terrae]MRS61219.1 hypothetical protein [Larkinella terrae]